MLRALLQTPFIPAQAGIQSHKPKRSNLPPLGPRFRGDERLRFRCYARC